MNEKRAKIKDFIYSHIEEHSSNIISLTAKEFGFSRQNAYKYIAAEIKSGKIFKVGKTNAARYFLASGKSIQFDEEIRPELSEDKIWSRYIKPMIIDQSDNFKNIVAYGFTEIYNNAIDHSSGTVIHTEVEVSDAKITIWIMDNGVGIFKKIQHALKLESIRESILHLSKGKFTTDPDKHTGEGIFFTSRIFSCFAILSSDLFYQFKNNDWLLSQEKNDDFGDGTVIKMDLDFNVEYSPKEIMDKYSNDNFGFDKTTVSVSLSSDIGDPHVSRSQAKRLMMGLDKFKKILLNFAGVTSVGQAFVDEIFRIFKNEHPEISISYINANEQVTSMIKRGMVTK